MGVGRLDRDRACFRHSSGDMIGTRLRRRGNKVSDRAEDAIWTGGRVGG